MDPFVALSPFPLRAGRKGLRRVVFARALWQEVVQSHRIVRVDATLQPQRPLLLEVRLVESQVCEPILPLPWPVSGTLRVPLRASLVLALPLCGVNFALRADGDLLRNRGPASPRRHGDGGKAAVVLEQVASAVAVALAVGIRCGPEAHDVGKRQRQQRVLTREHAHDGLNSVIAEEVKQARLSPCLVGLGQGEGLEGALDDIASWQHGRMGRAGVVQPRCIAVSLCLARRAVRGGSAAAAAVAGRLADTVSTAAAAAAPTGATWHHHQEPRR
mmetsp:Transcript_105653/g.305437  ORF Transcript_105653/g.305437 Transcript_105653/m.305437 type:complete len:273 (-) Transcript_105653:63-881(-)